MVKLDIEEIACLIEDRILSSDIYASILDGKISVEHGETKDSFNGCEVITVPFNSDFWCDNYRKEESLGLKFGEPPAIDSMIIEALNDYIKRKNLRAIVERGGSEIGDIMKTRFYIFHLN